MCVTFKPQEGGNITIPAPMVKFSSILDKNRIWQNIAKFIEIMTFLLLWYYNVTKWE